MEIINISLKKRNYLLFKSPDHAFCFLNEMYNKRRSFSFTKEGLFMNKKILYQQIIFGLFIVFLFTMTSVYAQEQLPLLQINQSPTPMLSPTIDIKAKEFYAQGLSYFEQKKYEEAAQAFQEAINLQPDYQIAFYYLGITNSWLYRFPEAEKALKEAIRFYPQDFYAYKELADVYTWLERYEDSFQYSQEAVRLKPDYADAYVTMGLSQIKLQRYENAIKILRVAITLDPNLEYAYFYLGVALSWLHRFQEAKDAHLKAIQLKPDFADAHLELGVVYVWLGDKTSAIEQYNILKNLDSNKAQELLDVITR